MLLAVIVLVSAGCYHLTGQVIERDEIKSTLRNSSTKTDQLPEKSGVYVRAGVTDDTLHLTAERQTWCRDTTTSVYARVSNHHRALPGGHWWVLGAGVGMLAGGATVALVGNSMISDGTHGPLGDSSLERKYDQGRVLLPVGLVVGGLGLLLTGSEVYDILGARHSREELPPDTKEERRDRVCTHKPEPGVELTLESAGNRHMVKADSHGRVDVPLLDGTLQNFPFATPFLSVTCNECRGATEVVLPVEQSARFVAARGKKEEMEGWLDKHEKHPSAESVRLALKKVVDDDRARGVDEIRSQARQKLDEADFDQAENLAARCLDAMNANSSCAEIQTKARRGIAANALASAKKQMAANKISDASISVGRCLRVEPENAPCMEIQQRLQSKLDKLTKEAAKRRPIVSIENVRGRIDADGNPWVSFEATASRAFRTGWIAVKAKCKTGNKTKVDESQALFSEVDSGDTKELEEPFSKITLPEGAEWCQFEFRYKENVFFSAGVPLRVFCWQGREVIPDTKCPPKATDSSNPPPQIRRAPANQSAWPDGPEGADHNW